MKNRRYTGYFIVIAYLILLRVVLNITIGINVLSLGTLFDVVLMMFWVGVLAFFMKKHTTQKVYYIIVIVVATIFVVGDSVYFDYFEVISSRSSLSGLQWLKEGNTLEYDIKIPLVAYLITPLLLIAIYLIITNKKKDVFHLRDFAVLSTIFVVQVALFLVWGNQKFETRLDFYRSDAYLFETMHDRSLFSEKYGYYNYHMLDISRIRTKPDLDSYYDTVDDYFSDVEQHESNDYSNLYDGYNVITILGETLETRFIDPILTPHLYEMYNQGITFDNYFTTVFQQGATCNSEYMSLTGLGAITSNDWSNNMCDSYSGNTFTYSLPNQLNNMGYNTYYFHSGYEWFYNRSVMIPSYGFETVKFQEDIYEAGYNDFYDRFDTDMLDFFTEYVNYDDPFYINLLTYSMHGAYNQEEFDIHSDQVEAAYPNNDIPEEIYNYMEKLVEFDSMLGEIKARLQANGELDNTLFVIYPDHYPYMMDYDTYTDYIGVEDNFYEVMRQELIIYATDMTGQVISNPGSTVDVTPTVLNLLNSNAEFGYFVGNDLLSDEANFIIFSDLTISDGKNFLYLDESYYGDPLNKAILEDALDNGITTLEMQKKLLLCDYFKRKEDIN